MTCIDLNSTISPKLAKKLMYFTLVFNLLEILEVESKGECMNVVYVGRFTKGVQGAFIAS